MISATAAPDYSVAQPRVRVDVTTTAASPKAVGSTATLAIYRVNPDGKRHRVITEAGTELIGGIATVFDYHAPFNTPVSYYATASGYSSDPVTTSLVSSRPWLMHPTNPGLSVRVDEVITIGDQAADTTAVLSYAFAAEDAISLYDGTGHSPASTFSILSYSKANQDALKSLFRDGGPLLVNFAGPDLGSKWWDLEWAWVQRGQVSYGSANLTTGFRITIVPYTTISTPAGIAVPLWTCQNLMDAYATCDAAERAYANAGDMATNTIKSGYTADAVTLTEVPGDPGYYFPTGMTEVPDDPGYYYITSTAPLAEYDGGFL